MKLVSNHRMLAGTLLAMCAGLTLYGCKDFLNQAATPQGALDASTLQTKSGVEGTLVAAYRAVECTSSSSAWGCAVSDWPFGSVTSDEAYKGSESGDQPPLEDLEEYHWSTPDAQGYLNGKWRQMYEGVVRANSTLRLLNAVKASSPGSFTAADANGVAGEALFLRAHFHFELWRMWGNIPYYRESDTDFRKANETSAQVAADLLKDLDSAIVLLPATPRGGQPGRATKWTAMAYKGRVQIYNQDYAGALTTLRAVQASNVYGLQPSYDQVWTGYKQYENGPETIFAFQASINDGNSNAQNSNYGEILNFPHSGSPFGCCGFHQPSQNLVNSFLVDANGLPLAITSPSTWNTNNNNFSASDTTQLANRAIPVDPRLDYTVGRDGVPFKDWGVHQASWPRSPAYSGPYSPKKHIHERASGAESAIAGGGWASTAEANSVNIHIFRYADLLLMLAEAEVEAGSLTKAQAIVNQVRARAGVKVQGCGTPSDAALAAAELKLYPTCTGDARIYVPINDPSVLWATYRVGQYTTPWTDQTAARDAVRFERKIELAMEGQRFFDLRRWKIADQVLNAYINGVGGGSEKSRRIQLANAETFSSRHALYPIPDVQLKMSNGNIKQNPGW